ncbi:MAG: DUF362 domain-containing protein [candidate division Zixibacteria bacterium]|nr:DUF362 domain-containing protein [candidate division Zixibacteria bacterium]
MYKLLKTRRSFIKSLLKGAGSLLAIGPLAKYIRADSNTLDPRVRVPNPYVMPDGRPKLVCVTGDNYGRMLHAGLAAIGGLDLLIDNQQDVLIKPNFTYTEPYPTTSAAGSVVSTIEAVQQVSLGTINVGDAGGDDNQDIYDYLEIEVPITDAGANLILFEDTYDVRRDTWPIEIPDFKVWTDIYDTPILINLCSLKRHYASFLTCAIKNHVGSVSGPDRADTRGYLHNFDDESFEFLTTISEIAGLINPELTIVDAREFMAVNGPLLVFGGEIRPMNKIVICGDMVATDAYCSQLMDEYDETYDPSRIIPTLERAEQLGLGTADLSQVEIIETEQTDIDSNPGSNTPVGFELHQNYPNPFNASTKISFAIPERSHVSIKVYDILGREVANLADGYFDSGRHVLSFKVNGLSSGTYYCRLVTPGFSDRKAMVFVK